MSMRQILPLLFLALAVGCGSGDKPAPEADSNPEPPTDAVDLSFAVRLPPKSVLPPGGMEEIDVEYVHSDEITGAITVTFEPPEGVTVTPKSIVLDQKNSKVKATIAVAETVAPGELEVSAVAALGEQEPATLTIPLTVKPVDGE